MKRQLKTKISGCLKGIFLFVSLMILGTQISAQVSFTQTSNADFYKGAYNDVLVASDQVYLPYQADDVNTWLTTTVLPQTLEGHKAATWNNRYVYVVGGYNDVNYSDAVYRATLQSGGISGWTTENPLPVALRDAAVVIGTNTIYVLGGRDASNIYNTVYYAEINANGSLGSWQTASITLPANLWGHTAVYCNGYIYVAGGADNLTATSARSNVYYAKVLADNTLSAFSAATSLPQTRNGHSMVVDGNKIYILGGFSNGGTKTNTVYYATSGANGALGSWSSATALPVTISNHSSVIMNGLITVMGGESGGTLSNNVYYADVNSTPLVWHQATNVMYDRTKDGAAFATNGWIGYCGGENLSGTPIHNSRYATLNLTSNYETNGFFIGNTFFELGAERTITELTFTTSNPAVSNTQISYRTAGDDLDWTNWTAVTSTSPITVGVTAHYLQYKVIFTGDGNVTPVLYDMNLWTPGTELSGNLNSWTTFDYANSPYWVTADISFTAGTHTFEAGVEINFLPETGMTVSQASIICNGNSTDSVYFKGYTGDNGLWDGIYFDPDSDNGVSSQLYYTVIDGGGFGSWDANLYCYSTNEPFLGHCSIRNADGNGVRLNTAHLNFEFCNIENNSENGIYLENSNPTFVTCDIGYNGAAGLYFTSNSSDPTYSSSTIHHNLYGMHYPSPNYTLYPPNGNPTVSNNTYNGIAIDGGTITSGSRVWNSMDYDFILLGDITIQQYHSNPRLTIEPGNTVKCVDGVQIQVGTGSSGGELYAIGSADSVTTFTSWSGLPGGWDGIYFSDYSDEYGSGSVLDYCVIENGNDYNYYAVNTGGVQIQNSTIQNAFVDGARYNNSFGSILNCSFLNNGRYPLYFTDWSASPVHTNCTVSGNQVDMIAIEGGNYNDDRTLLYDNGIHYLVLNDIILQTYHSYHTLTVEPGVTVEFNSGTKLQIGSGSNGGSLFAEGTSGSPITFKAFNDTQGGWEGLYFTNYSDEYGSNSSLKYCTIEQGNDYNVYCEYTSQPSFENCIFRNAVNDGVKEYSSSPQIHSCQFTNNGGYPLEYLTWDCNSHLNGNSYSGNGLNFIALSGGHYTASRTLYNDGIHYRVLSDIEISVYHSTIFLTVEPGTTLEFDSGTKLQIGAGSNGGSLIANGNADSVITFKAYNDTPGGWEGLYFTNYSDEYGSYSSLKYCTIEQGNNYNMYCESTIQPATFENCELTDALNDGLKLYNATIGPIKNTTFSHNGNYGIYIDGSSNPDIGNDPAFTCNLYGNTGGYEVYNNSGNDIDARYNYWGTGDSAMIAVRIFDYYDNSSKGEVIFGDFAQIPYVNKTTTLLTGDVWYNNSSSTAMDNALMEIFDFSGTPVASTSTNSSGHYSFGSFSSGGYTLDITPSSSWGGVNSTDALLILNHFAHIDTLEGMELAASDVNHSQTINGTDALFVMKRYTGMISSFPSGDWLYNAENLAINGNQVTNDFSMLCFGDVNSSYTPSKKEGGSVSLVYEGSQVIQSFSDFDLTVSVKDMIETGAISLGLVYPSGYMEITGAELLNTNGSAIYTSEEGLFRIAWADLNSVNYNAGDGILLLHCTAKDLSSLQEPIQLGLFDNSEFADPQAQVIENVTLSVPELSTLAVGVDNRLTEGGLWLGKNYPNPFNNTTTIKYRIAESGNVTLKIYNLVGESIAVPVNEEKQPGEYSVKFDCNGLEPGMYLYELQFTNTENNYKLVNKMSITK